MRFPFLGSIHRVATCAVTAQPCNVMRTGAVIASEFHVRIFFSVNQGMCRTENRLKEDKDLSWMCVTREAPSSCTHSLKTEIPRYHLPTHQHTLPIHTQTHTPMTTRCYHREDEGIPGTEKWKVQPAANSLRAQRKPYISIFYWSPTKILHFYSILCVIFCCGCKNKQEEGKRGWKARQEKKPRKAKKRERGGSARHTNPYL